MIPNVDELFISPAKRRYGARKLIRRPDGQGLTENLSRDAGIAIDLRMNAGHSTEESAYDPGD